MRVDKEEEKKKEREEGGRVGSRKNGLLSILFIS